MTINEYLDELVAPKLFKNRTVAEIWSDIVEKKSYDEIGFDNEEQRDEWIRNNPYENI